MGRGRPLAIHWHPLLMARPVSASKAPGMAVGGPGTGAGDRDELGGTRWASVQCCSFGVLTATRALLSAKAAAGD